MLLSLFLFTANCDNYMFIALFPWHNYYQIRVNFFSGIDLALLSYANHSIMTYGTFGMWGALLAGGQATLPATHTRSKESQEILTGNVNGWIFL